MATEPDAHRSVRLRRRARRADRFTGRRPLRRRPERNNTGTTVQYESLAGPRLGRRRRSIRTQRQLRLSTWHRARRCRGSSIEAIGGVAPHALRQRRPRHQGADLPAVVQPVAGFDLGNPDLKPERSRGFDVGVEQRFARDRVQPGSHLLRQPLRRSHQHRAVRPGHFDSQYVNIGETRASGLELAGTALVSGAVRIHGCYTCLDSKVINAASAAARSSRQGSRSTGGPVTRDRFRGSSRATASASALGGCSSDNAWTRSATSSFPTDARRTRATRRERQRRRQHRAAHVGHS